MSRLIISILVALAGVAVTHAETSTKPIAIYYDGNTQVNGDTIHFLEEQSRRQGYNYPIVPISNSADLVAGKFRAIVVLNTGLEKGIDRKLADFVQGWGDKRQLILVDLLKGSTSLNVETYPAAPANLGVDAVTAASKWEGRGLSALFGGTSDVLKMHVSWTKWVFDRIGQL